MSKIVSNKRSLGEINIYSITWTVLISRVDTKELYAESSKAFGDDPDSLRIRFRAQILGRNNDVIEFYYLSHSTVFWKLKLTYDAMYDRQNRIIEKDYHTVQSNKWQYIDTLIRENLNTMNELKLRFEFSILNGIQEEQSDVLLNNDLEILLENGSFSDLTMKSVDGKEYKVHKAMLASRSVVLKAHFEHNTTECHNNIVESPFEAEVLSEVLTFIYCDKAPKVDKIPENLLAAADYYQLSRLISLCEEALHKKLTVENAIDTLHLAKLHSAKALEQLTLDFIKDGQAKHLVKTEAWAKLSSIELMKTIIEHILLRDQEKVGMFGLFGTSFSNPNLVTNKGIFN